MLAIAGAILIAAAVLFAIFVSWAWLTSGDGKVPERRAWTEEARRPDPRFDEWSAFNRANPDTSSLLDGKSKQSNGQSKSK